MSANTWLIEALTRHQIFLERRSSGIVNELNPVLERMSDDIRQRLLLARTDFQVYRLERLLRDVREVIELSGGEYGEQLQLALEELTEYEAGFTQRALENVINVPVATPAPEQLIASVTQASARIVQGKNIVNVTVPQLVDQFTRSKRDQVLQAVRAGFIAGDPLDVTVRNISSITDRQMRRQAASMVRTATNHMATQARKATYDQNSDVLEGLERTAVLDGRTSLQCLANDGRIYPVDTTDLPPYHFSCRTVMVPKVRDAFTLFRDKGQRASKDGPVDAQLTYSGFLKRQSKEFQDEVLGVERASLFRSGKVTLDKFVDEQGRTLTLNELRQREGLTLQQ